MMQEMLFAIVSYIAVLNPLTIPIYFMAFTEGKNEKECRRMAIRAASIAGMLAIGAILFGDPLMKLLGVRISSFQIAGGLVLCVFGMRKGLGISRGFVDSTKDPASIPLASPLMAGPGTLSLSILLANQVGAIITIIAMLIMLVLITIGMIYSESVSRLMGRTGMIITSHIMGLILVAFAVQFIITGLTNA